MAQNRLIGLWLALFGLGLLVTSGASAFSNVSDDRQVFAWTLVQDKGAILVDLRDRRPYERGHLDMAINIPLPDIVSGSVDLGKDKTRFFVLYGEPGFRVSDVTALMVKKGYTNTFYAGSYQAMRDAHSVRVYHWPYKEDKAAFMARPQMPVTEGPEIAAHVATKGQSFTTSLDVPDDSLTGAWRR